MKEEETRRTATIRVHRDTRKHLRFIAAETEEMMMDIVARLALAEWQRIQEQATTDKQDDN